MARRRFLRALGPALLLSLGGAYALASYNWCGRWPAAPPTLISSQAGEGPLRAGAARVPLTPPYPVVRAGYGPPRPSVSSAELPLHARALILEQGSLRVGLVSLELLLIPDSLTDAVREATTELRLDELWVAATHSHSAMGAFDPRVIFQLAGTGRFREAARQAAVDAATSALRQAAAGLVAVQVENASGELGDLVRSRVAAMEPDRRVTRLRLFTPIKTVAEVVVLSAHPTLAPRQGETLSPDYPGWLSEELEVGQGVALVMMGAVGNSSTAGVEQAASYGHEVVQRLKPLKPRPLPPRLSFATVRAALPRPDASRLVPGVVRRAGENFLCTSAPRTVEVSVLQLGDLRLGAVPGELTVAAANTLEQQTGMRTVSLVNDYLGYVEEPELARRGGGESRRQYFAPELANVLTDALRLAAESL